MTFVSVYAKELLILLNESKNNVAKQITEFEKEVTKLKARNREKKKYKLHAVEGRFFTYILKDSSTSEPKPWLCAICYEDNKKSILQCTGLTQNIGSLAVKDIKKVNFWECNICKFKTHLDPVLYFVFILVFLRPISLR